MPNRRQLWQLAAERSEQALRSGALEPIPTHRELLVDGEVTFLVHQVLACNNRENLGVRPPASAKNPFSCPDPALLVTLLGETHLVLLNKYSVFENHLLLVTRQFEEQESLLTLEDFRAAWACLWDTEALVFYNAGSVAGASQPHKHLQVVRLPLLPSGPPVPLGRLLDRVVFDGQVSRAPRLPFANGLARLDPSWNEDEAARASHDLYRRMVDAFALSPTSQPSVRPRAYNLLLTRDWLLLVPRSQECLGTISINALGYAGALLVKSQAERQALVEAGPMKALTLVGVPRPLSERPPSAE